MTPAPLPTVQVPRTDWHAIWAELQAAPDGLSRPYTAALGDTRRFNLWARRFYRRDVYYRTESPGVVRFSLHKQRG